MPRGPETGDEDGLAELPFVTPGSGDDDTEAVNLATDPAHARAGMAPAVLLLTLLLLLLLATPLAPARRVRAGYRGRRRK